MAKGAYVGVGGVARKIKKMYVGVDGVARKVKKGYIGIGGVARLFFWQKELAYHGDLATSMRASRLYPAAASIEGYGFFAGGIYKSGSSLYVGKTVDAYDKSLIRHSASDLSSAVCRHSGASVGDYAIFAGGCQSTSSSVSSSGILTVRAYSSSLTSTSATNLSAVHVQGASASTGTYAIFAGGYYRNTVQAYNSSLTRSTLTSLPVSVYYNSGTSVGDYAIVAGGRQSGTPNLYDVVRYDSSGTQGTETTLGTSLHGLAAATIDEYALFAGGTINGGSQEYGSVVVIDTSLTIRATVSLGEARTEMVSVSLPGYAVFAGGYCNGSYSSDQYPCSTIDIFDDKFTRIGDDTNSFSFYGGAGVSVGDYGIIAGGHVYGAGTYNDGGIVYALK